MKYFVKKKNDVAMAQSAVAQSAAARAFLAPVGPDGLPAAHPIVSHQHNSHTLRPKLVNERAEYPEAFCGLDDVHCVDYPGLFESKGAELDIAMQITLQKVIMRAKSARVLVLVSASTFLGENQRTLSVIKQKLSAMFGNPEKHVVIGITKTRAVIDSIGEPEDVLSMARGEGGELVSLSGYTLAIVEQDDVALLQGMVATILAQGCAKRYATRGFLDSSEVLAMFEKVKPDDDLRAKQASEWIHLLNA